MHDAGAGLAARGHRVDLVTGQPRGLTSRDRVDGVSVRYVRTLAAPARGWRAESVFGVTAAAAAWASRADVVTSYLYADALGAGLSRRLCAGRRRHRPVVLKLTGTVPRDSVAGQRIERGLLRRALDEADAVWVNSDYAREAMAGWDRPMDVVPAGVDLDVFTPGDGRAAAPTVLCTAAADEPRKRLADLVTAWTDVLAAVPAARLVVAQAISAPTRERLTAMLPAAARPSVGFAGQLDDRRLAAAYRSAWVTVAPAVHEALGLATVESLACGTPVVGADSGATPGLLTAPATGAVYAPGDTGALAAAVAARLAAPPDGATATACRAAATPFAWPTILDDYERRYAALLGG